MKAAIALSLAASLVFGATHVFAQAAFPPPPKVSPAAGVVDLHVHSHPDVFCSQHGRHRHRQSRQGARHARHRAQEPHQRAARRW
jgi:hypothetical protein